MTDLERRLRDTYAAALDGVEAADRLGELPVPAASPRRTRSLRFAPAMAFGAAAVATVLVIGGLAVFRPGGEGVPARVAAEQTVHIDGDRTLTEIRFADASIVATGGIAGRPAVVALTEDGGPVLRQMVEPGQWDEQAIDPWNTTEVLRGSASDGDAFALVLGGAPDESRFAIRLTTNGIDWATFGFAPSTATQAYGNPAARRSIAVEDVSVDGDRVTVLVRSDPSPDVAALQTSLEDTGVLSGDQVIEQVEEWGPDGIAVRLTSGERARYELADLGIDPSWVYSAWEVWTTLDDGSTRGIPIDGGRVTPLEPTDWQPETATSAGDSVYVGGSRNGVAVVAVSDLSTGVIEPFTELNLSDLTDEAVQPLLAATSLRTAGGVVVAGISTPGVGVAVRLDGTALTAWAMEEADLLVVADMAVRGNLVATVGYPGVIVTQNDFTAAAPSVASISTDFGISDRHPTNLTLTDAGVITLPQAGTNLSTFGTDGSAWLIDLGGAEDQPSG